MQQRSRRASRLLVEDRQYRVLLLQYEDERGKWWATPGGGAEETESFVEAAAREAREELGLNGAPLAPLWCRLNEFTSRGIQYRQTEQFFLIWADESDVRVGREVHEARIIEGILAARWWPLDELCATTQRVFPEDLLARIENLSLR